MAYVVTTFFAMGFGYAVAATSLGRPIRGMTAAWIGFAICLVGTLMAVGAILSGQASVLYTFYPPLLASGWYYGGAFLLIGGSMIWVVLMILNMRDWKRDNPGRPVPLPMFAITATAMLWAWAASGVLLELGGILLPRAFGWSDLIDAATRAHPVLGDVARHRVFLADAGVYRLLHAGAAGGGRAALQRYDGAAHLHHVPRILAAGRDAPSLHGPRTRVGLQVPAVRR